MRSCHGQMMVVQRMALFLNKRLSSRVPLTFATTTRRLTADARRILMSPPLTSIDLPDIWTQSNCSNFPSITKSCSNLQTTTVIDGRKIAEEVTTRIASEVMRMKNSVGRVPGLAVIMVGERRDSQTYVRNKIAACEEAGIRSKIATLPENCREDEVLKALSCFHEDPAINGILVQLPLPQHLDEEKILNALQLEKDVDGFHPVNMGNLAMRGREPLFLACTPKGCVELLMRCGVEISGKKAVVIGRSNVVGLPMSLLLQRHHATVSIVHAFTGNPEQITRQADIVVAAAGVPNLVRGNWLKSGAVVIDVGTNPIEDPTCEQGYRLIGDVCYEEAVRVASAITPVPGGVGPMTVAMLLYNTLQSARRAYNFI